MNRRNFLRSLTMASMGAAARQGVTPLAGQDPIAFEDAATKAGIHFALDNSAGPHRYQVETMAGGVAVFDYNNDGLLDIYFANGAHLPDMDKSDERFYNRLYRNNGDGTFTDVTKEAGVEGAFYSIGLAAADYDNDGYQDLFVAGANGFQLFHNNGNGTFTDVTESAGLRRIHPDLTRGFAAAAGWFDYDNDGYLDLIVINYLRWTPETNRTCVNNGVTAFCSPDVYTGMPNLLFHNNGDGTFTDVSESSGILAQVGKGMGVAFADYDGDGYTDIFVANDTYRNFLFHNNGNGTFTEVGILSGVAYSETGKSVAGMGVDFRDVDNDGKPDLFVTDMFGNGYLYFRNVGHGVFDDCSSRSHIYELTIRRTGWGTGIYDLDNNGLKDIFCCNAGILDNARIVDGTPYRMKNAIYRNNGDGTFSDASREAGPDFQRASTHRGAAFGDFNNDGRIDVVTNCLNAAPELLLNRTRNGNHWLLIELEGSRSNRDGLGAEISVLAGGHRQYNHATTSVGYGSSSDRRVHFGLGRAARAEQVEIRWPSGTYQTLRDVKADQVLKVREPEKV